jgi:hypothetical protein
MHCDFTVYTCAIPDPINPPPITVTCLILFCIDVDIFLAIKRKFAAINIFIYLRIAYALLTGPNHFYTLYRNRNKLLSNQIDKNLADNNEILFWWTDFCLGCQTSDQLFTLNL